MTSQWRHYYVGELHFPEAPPLQESVAIATAKDLHSNFYLLTNSYIFAGKVTKFGWIIFLFLWVMAKTPPNIPWAGWVKPSKMLSVIGGRGLPAWPIGLTHLTHGSLHFWIEWQRVSFRITSGMHSYFVSAFLFYIESEMFTLRLPVVFFSI